MPHHQPGSPPSHWWFYLFIGVVQKRAGQRWLVSCRNEPHKQYSAFPPAPALKRLQNGVWRGGDHTGDGEPSPPLPSLLFSPISGFRIHGWIWLEDPSLLYGISTYQEPLRGLRIAHSLLCSPWYYNNNPRSRAGFHSGRKASMRKLRYPAVGKN